MADRDDNLIYGVVERIAADVHIPGPGLFVEETTVESDGIVYHLSDGGTVTISVDHQPPRNAGENQ